MPERPTVTSYTIYHSPNAYLGIVLAERALAALPVRHERRPILIPRSRGVRVADLVGGHESPAKASYHREDCIRWARRHGIALRLLEPGEFERRAEHWVRAPLEREELPARAFYAALDLGRARELDRALFEAAWGDGRDVNEEAVVREAATRVGLDADGLLERALREEAGLRVRTSLAEFDAAQCPGIPCFVFQGQRFWGKDRIADLVEALQEAGVRSARAAGESPRGGSLRTDG